MVKTKKASENSSFFVALIFIIFGTFSLFLWYKPVKTFKNEPVKVSNFEDNKTIGAPERIVVPRLAIDLPVKPAKIVRGYWEVFDDQAGWGEGSGIPGEPGNQVVFAHAKPGLFEPLKSVDLGDRIEIFSADKVYEYEVKEIKTVYPNQIEVIEPTDDETLTLYTCSGFSDQKRLIVVAKRAI